MAENGFDNIILIGMPGSGKSTVGVLLAKALCVDFADTDLILQRAERRPLKNIIDTVGPEGFLEREADMICSLDIHDSVIATGGSVVCRQRAVDRLHEAGTVVWIDVPYETIEQRLGGISGMRARGVAIGKGQTLKDIWENRRPLYEKAADIHVESGSTMNAEQCCGAILRALIRHESEVSGSRAV